MMLPSFFLIAIATLLPCLQCQQQALDDPLCGTMRCSEGEMCRHTATCGHYGGPCRLSAMCTAERLFTRGCEIGHPLLHRINYVGQWSYMRCSKYNRCPRGSHCSSILPNRPARCCYDFPTIPEASAIKEGICPDVTYDFNIDECDDFVCNHDSDCSGTSKCCYSGCRKECMAPASAPSTLPSTHASNTSGDPCDNKECPADQVCKHYKACGLYGDCNVTAICTSNGRRSDRCENGRSPVLYNNDGELDDLWCAYNSPRGCREGEPGCFPGHPCPSNAYCDTSLMDVASVCCFSLMPSVAEGLLP